MLRVHINGEKALSRSEPRLFRTRNCHGPLLFGTARTTFLRFGSVPQKTWTNVRLVVVAPSAARLSTGPKISVWAIKRHATMRYHSTRTTDTHMQMSTLVVVHTNLMYDCCCTVAVTKEKAFTAVEQNSSYVGFSLHCLALAPRKAAP